MIIDLRRGKTLYLSFICILIFGAVFLSGMNRSSSSQVKPQSWPGGGEDGLKSNAAEGHLLDIDHNVLYSAGIDTVYQWHTFLGSPTGSDSGKALVLNEAGEIFVVGNSSVAWEGPGNIPPLNDYSGSDDIVVVKLDKNGFYQWHTFYGSLEGDLGEAVALDQAGNIYVAGKSRFTWDGPLGQAPLNSHEGCNNDDLVVIKLNSDGDYQWHTFYGSAYQDLANAIVLDPTGNLYLTGRSDSPWDGPGGEDPLNAHSGGDWDLYVLKLNSAGDYLWHSFYGSLERDEGYALALGSAGDIYLTGRSDASWDGPDGESPVNNHAGSDRDLVLMKISPAGTYHWHAFYGSTEADLGHSITVGSDDHIYLAGESNASWNGPGGEHPLNAHNNGARDVVIIKVNSSGIYRWHTFYGSEQRDLGYAIALDRADNIYVTGYSEDYWAGSGGEGPLDPFIDNDANILVIKLAPAGAYCWHSFYGHTGWNQGRSLATDDTDNLYLAGHSSFGWDGPNEEDPRNAHSGTLNSEITVIKAYTDPSPEAKFFSNPTSGPNPLAVQFTDQSTRNPLGWAWYFGDEDLSSINWTEKTGSAAWSGRYGHAAVALPDGSIALMGGKINGDRLNDVWHSTDRGQTWTLVNSNAAWPKRFNHAGIVLPDGSIILMGGDGETDKLNDVWRSTDQGLTWKRLSFDAGWSKRSHLSAVALSDGSIVVMGGDDGSYQNDVWRSLDRGATWTRLTDDAPWPGRYGHSSAVLPGDGIVLMGGEDSSGLTSDVWLSTDYGTGWAEMTGNDAWSARRWHTSTVLPDGSILITGGWDGSAALNDLWRSVDGGRTWTEIHSSTDWEARALHAGTVLNDGSVVLLGGHDGTGPRNDVWSLKTAGSNEQNPVHTYHQPGSYQVTLQSYNACGYSSISKSGHIEVRLPGSDAKLAGLVISAGELVPGFHADINEYTVDVAHDIDTIVITANLSDANSSITLDGALVDSGVAVTVTLDAQGTVTVIKIKVTAEDGVTENTYTIKVNRAEEPGPPTGKVTRLCGYNRYETAVTISTSGWDSADTVVLARGDDYPDALAGVPLAYHFNAPILLSPTANLPDATEKEIKRLGATRIIILGGSVAISENVKSELETKGLSVERIAGTNRYHTAALIAERLDQEGVDFDTAFIAVGTNFADALSASAYAAIRGEPILLTATTHLPEVTSDALNDLGIGRTYVCGGLAAVSGEVFDLLPNPNRVFGINRYDTARALADEFLPMGATHVGIATGLNFPDAIAGGVWAAKKNTGIFLVDGSKDKPRDIVEDLVTDKDIKAVTLFGGTIAISSAMEDWFENNLNN